MRTLIALALLACSTPVLAEHRTERLRTECYGNRCVVYDRSGRRVGTVTQEVGNRVAVRDRGGRLQEKITRQGSTVIVDRRTPRK
jgi:hypothetical protein